MNRKLILVSLWVASLAICALAQDIPRSDQRTRSPLERIQNLSAGRLDKTLPDIRLQEWLQSLVGVNVEIGWVLRYAPGDAKDGPVHEVPDCVEADVTLQDGRSFFVLVAVGTIMKAPFFHSGAIIENKRVKAELRRLGDLPRLLRETDPRS